MSSFHRHSPSPSSSLAPTQPATPSSTLLSSPSSTSNPTSTSVSTPTPAPPTSPTNLTPIVVAVVAILLVCCGSIFGYLIYRRRNSRRQLQHEYERHSAYGGGYQAELDDRPATTSGSTKRPEAVGKNHVAAKITPYGSSTNLVPRFNHSPGNDMRIATRRPDGAWEFSNPGAAFNPSGVDEIEPPASASTSMYSPTPTKSTFKVPMTPRTPTKFSASIKNSLPPTPETPSFPPGLPPSTPSPLLSLPPSTPTTPRNLTTFPASSSSSSSARPASQLTTSTMEPPKSPAQIMKEHESRAARLIRQGYDDREFSDEVPPPAYGHDPCYLDHTREPSLE